MTLTPDHVVQFIQRNPDCSYDDIKARARELQIPDHQLMGVMAKVHKRRDIRTTQDLRYRYHEPKPRTTTNWRYEPYPTMDSTNNAEHEVFAGMDFSSLFLTPEERHAYARDQAIG